MIATPGGCPTPPAATDLTFEPDPRPRPAVERASPKRGSVGGPLLAMSRLALSQRGLDRVASPDAACSAGLRTSRLASITKFQSSFRMRGRRRRYETTHTEERCRGLFHTARSSSVLLRQRSAIVCGADVPDAKVARVRQVALLATAATIVRRLFAIRARCRNPVAGAAAGVGSHALFSPIARLGPTRCCGPLRANS